MIKEYYAKYLREVRGNSERTVRHYFDALNNISRRLKQMGLVQQDVYEITDTDRLMNCKEALFSDPDFIRLNSVGNQMYSAGLNNYIRFISGADFTADRRIEMLDMPMTPESQIVGEHESWRRSGLMRNQIIVAADYKCEIDGSHESFTAEATGKPYMEGHHAIPLRKQPLFSLSLDVYANIICLCPICHRRIHYGLKEDKGLMMNKIYSERADRLYKSGIRLSKEEFVEMVV